MTIFYSGVGSRETPDPILELMYDIGKFLAREGYTLRSGGADGADAAFESGCDEAQGLKEIYIPWEGFSDRSSQETGVVHIRDSSPWFAPAVAVAESIHPAWDRLSRGAKGLHARNIYQVLGMKLNLPSKFLIAYTKPTKTSVSGGTRTAWECAKMNNVPCYNLFDEAVARKFRERVS